jgi:hypothetical protein
VRSNDSRDVANSPRRIPTVCSSFEKSAKRLSVPPWNSSTCAQTCSTYLNTSQHKLPVLPFNGFEGLTLPELSQLLIFQGTLHAFLAANIQLLLSVESLTLRTPAAAVLQLLLGFATLNFTRPAHSFHSSCAQLHFHRDENKSYLYLNPLSTHSLRTLRLQSLQEFSGSNRETIETHSFFLSDFNSNMKSYTQHIKENV